MKKIPTLLLLGVMSILGPDALAREVPSSAAPVNASFIQLNRDFGSWSDAQWRAALEEAKSIGVDTVIVQWSAEGDVAYFEPSPIRYTESFPAVNRILRASERLGLKVVLGLSHDPEYWRFIKARDDVREVYFRVRASENMELIGALLDVFGAARVWTGYYITEEIDDLSWREGKSMEIFRNYLFRLGRVLEAVDPDREVVISSFFRRRTAPLAYASNMRELLRDTVVDRVLIQDGVGVDPLPARFVRFYIEALSEVFSRDPEAPALDFVMEIFKQTSGPDEAFVAVSAPVERVQSQLENLAPHSSGITLFTLLDYAAPGNGVEAESLYQLIAEWNASIRSDLGED